MICNIMNIITNFVGIKHLSIIPCADLVGVVQPSVTKRDWHLFVEFFLTVVWQI